MDAYSDVECLGANSVVTDLYASPLPSVTFGDGPNSSSIYLNISESSIMRPNMTVSQLFFVDIPGNGTSGIIAATYQHSNSTVATLIPCTIRLGWIPSQLYVYPDHFQSIGDLYGQDTDRVRWVHFDRSWLQTINPFITAENNTLVGALSNWWSTRPEVFMMTSILSGLTTLTLAISTSPLPYSCATLSSDLPTDWYVKMMGVEPCAPLPSPSGSHTYSISFFVFGTGYQAVGLAVQISVIILCLYCVIAFGHIVWSIGWGISATSRDSVVKVVTLALNSRHPPELRNTCAGIESAEVFKHKVRIAPVNDEGDRLAHHLELVFPSSGVPDSSRIRYNDLYGAKKETRC